MGAKPRKLSHAAVLKRIRHWKSRMLLDHWKIGVSFEPDAEEGSAASCDAAPEYLHATLNFDMAKIDPDEIDHYIVHELSHCAIWPLAAAAHSMCGDDDAKLENVRVHEETLATYIERMVANLERTR